MLAFVNSIYYYVLDGFVLFLYYLCVLFSMFCNLSMF